MFISALRSASYPASRAISAASLNALDRLSGRVTVKALESVIQEAVSMSADDVEKQYVERRLRAALAAIDTAPAPEDPSPPIITYDDGTEIHLSGFAGGAAPGGAWSTLTLTRCRPGHPDECREYTADGDWSSDGVPQAASKRIDTAPAPTPDQIRRDALRDALAVARDETTSIADGDGEIYIARRIADRIEALITGGDDDAA